MDDFFELSSGPVKLNNKLLAHWSKALWELKGTIRQIGYGAESNRGNLR